MDTSVAHLTLTSRITPFEAVRAMVGARFGIDRMIGRTARARAAEYSPAELAAQYRESATWTGRPLGTKPRDPLVDVLVHGRRPCAPEHADRVGASLRSGLMGFVGVADLDAAQLFYGEVLGLQLNDERPFALVADVDGTMLRITEVPEPAAAPYTVLGWSVDDIAATVDELAGRGVVFTRYEGMGQDERGVWTAPGGAKIAWFLDPDRNNLSLAEFPR